MSGLIARLANDLTPQFGRGFFRQNLQNMRLFYLNYPLDRIRQTVSGKSDDNFIEAQLGELFNAFPLPGLPACGCNLSKTCKHVNLMRQRLCEQDGRFDSFAIRRIRGAQGGIPAARAIAPELGCKTAQLRPKQ